MAENQKKISPEFITSVKKYLEIDDILKDIKEKSKKLNADKKNNEEFILEYLKSIDEKVIDVQDGKLRRNISKTQAPLKKELIQKTLSTIIGDNNKATELTDQIIKSRPTVEKVTLKRTKNRIKKENDE
jgi:transcription initiation factor TFIIIB Brf1 subunit/transcription initiation factor TFIIB